MRIRKDKKLAQLGLSSDAVHLCQLNQSPWDVPSTTAHLRTSSSSSSFQVGGGHEDEQVDTGNGSLLLGDSLGAFDSSVASMESMRYEEDELEDGNGIGREDKDVVSCNKTKGKGWQCKKAAKQLGEPMCRHQLKSPPPAAKKNKGGRGRGRPTKKADNPYTFYYYTGFGPTWGRKRSDAQSQSPAHHQVPILYDDDHDHDHDHDDSTTSTTSGKEDKDKDSNTDSESDGARKRTRRPVKERSLKSLM